MKIEKKRFGDVTLIKLTGDLDVFNLGDLQGEVDGLVDAGRSRFIINTHLLKFINSASLGYIVNRWKTLEKQGGALVISNPSKFMKRTMATIGLNMPVFESDEEALLHISQGGVAPADLPAPDAPDKDLTGKRTVTFRASEEDAARVGRIVSLSPGGMKFHYAPKDALDPVELGVAVGTKLKLKFTQPFIQKGHYFTPSGEVVKVDEVEIDDEKLLSIQMMFSDIDPKDQELLNDHYRAQDEWRKGLGDS